MAGSGCRRSDLLSLSLLSLSKVIRAMLALLPRRVVVILCLVCDRLMGQRRCLRSGKRTLPFLSKPGDIKIAQLELSMVLYTLSVGAHSFGGLLTNWLR